MPMRCLSAQANSIWKKQLRWGHHKAGSTTFRLFHFDEAALADFEEFRAELERRVRSGELSPAFEGHIAKYRKLVPALALINHIADNGDGPVAQKSLLRALAFVTYLESHARRVYGSTS